MQAMENWLTPTSTSPFKAVSTTVSLPEQSPYPVASPDSALEVLQRQPDHGALKGVLQYLASTAAPPIGREGFCIHTPGPAASRILNVLVSVTIPDYGRVLWQTERESHTLLLHCVTCFSGIGAIKSRLRLLIDDSRQMRPANQARDSVDHIADLVDILQDILNGDSFVSQMWHTIRNSAPNTMKRDIMWKDFTSWVAAGQLVSISAQAEDVLKERGDARKKLWLADGCLYGDWLGRNMAHAISRSSEFPKEHMDAISLLCGRSLSLGYTREHS